MEVTDFGSDYHGLWVQGPGGQHAGSQPSLQSYFVSSFSTPSQTFNLLLQQAPSDSLSLHSLTDWPVSRHLYDRKWRLLSAL